MNRRYGVTEEEEEEVEEGKSFELPRRINDGKRWRAGGWAACSFVRSATSRRQKVSNWLLHFKQATVRALIYFYFRPGNFRSRSRAAL